MLHWKMDSATATALLLGIYTDTGGFVHKNTDARTFNTAARLLAL
jgi:nanoRNase/pAp phosphatase (c-di-AMP/oligoRNAs hydrolase)